ncbi:hypothetical protein M8J76_014145 [Diaphorina citri]|nr:hypothetical protein M8J76_014145 [Diaphorina citri]KAI5750891.1 hypothetical protein M8J77_002252 [Diaphorina citri]
MNQLLKTCITLLSFSQMASSKKQFYPAADRNKQPILDVLKDHISLSDKRKCLEISSGSGQHVSFFAPHFPNVRFYPSEESRFLFDSINEHVKSDGLGNVEQARYIDASSPPETWYDGKLQKETLDYVYNCNMIHLVPFSTTEGLFRGSSYYLKPNGLLITYGAYADNGILTPESNVRFNESIKSLNPAHGIRDITLELVPAAKKFHFVLLKKYDMPANNKILVWQKQ